MWGFFRKKLDPNPSPAYNIIGIMSSYSLTTR